MHINELQDLAGKLAAEPLWTPEHSGPREIVILDDSELVVSHIQNTHALAAELFGDQLPVLRQECEWIHFQKVRETIDFYRQRLFTDQCIPPLILDLQLLDNERGTEFLHFMSNRGFVIPTVMFSAIHAQALQLPVIVGLASGINREIPLRFVSKTGTPERDLPLSLRLLEVEALAHRDIREPYLHAIRLIQQAEAQTQSVCAALEGPAYALAVEASNLTVDMKMLVTDCLTQLQEKFAERPELQANNQYFEKAQEEIQKRCLTPYADVAAENRNRTLTKEELEALGHEMDFFTFQQWVNIDPNHPLSIAPDQVWKKLFAVTDTDRSRNFTVPKDRPNDAGHFFAHVRKLFYNLPRDLSTCYGKEMPVGTLGMSNEVKTLMLKQGKPVRESDGILKEVEDALAPFQRQWEDMLQRLEGMIQQLYTYEKPEEFASIDHVLEAIRVLADHVETKEAQLETIPLEKLQIPKELFDFILHHIELNARHDTVPEDGKPIQCAKIRLVRGSQESANVSGSHLGKIPGPLARLEVTLRSHNSSFDKEALKRGKYFFSKADGGMGGNGYPPIADFLRGSPVNVILSNEDGVATVRISIPTYVPEDALDSLPLMTV